MAGRQPNRTLESWRRKCQGVAKRADGRAGKGRRQGGGFGAGRRRTAQRWTQRWSRAEAVQARLEAAWWGRQQLPYEVHMLHTDTDTAAACGPSETGTGSIHGEPTGGCASFQRLGRRCYCATSDSRGSCDAHSRAVLPCMYVSRKHVKVTHCEVQQRQRHNARRASKLCPN